MIYVLLLIAAILIYSIIFTINPNTTHPTVKFVQFKLSHDVTINSTLNSRLSLRFERLLD